MDAQRTIEFLRVFGVVILAVMLTGLDLWLLYRADLFRSAHHFEQHFIFLVAIVGGCAASIAPYEVASWTGRYGWTRATYRVLPEAIVQAIGIGALVVVTFRLLTQ